LVTVFDSTLKITEKLHLEWFFARYAITGFNIFLSAKEKYDGNRLVHGNDF
jgi:hypothetical protein